MDFLNYVKEEMLSDGVIQNANGVYKSENVLCEFKHGFR